LRPPEGFHDEAAEILRCTSVALGGAPVTVWEAQTGDTQHFQPIVGPAPKVGNSTELQNVLYKWRVPVSRGSRWLSARADDGQWVIAPVRHRPPAPPPNGHERRSKARLTLELAGLCLGLVDRRERPSASSASLQELAGLPAMIAHEAGNPLAAARAGLQLTLETLRGSTDLSAARGEVLEDLVQVLEDIDRAVGFLRAVQDRARGAFARVERFDLVRVVRSCLTLERRLLQDRRVALRLETAVESAYLTGDPNALYELVVNLVRNAADAYEGRPGTVDVDLSRDTDRLRLRVTDRGSGIAPENLALVFEPGFTTKEFGKGSGMGLALVRSVTQEVFGGSVHIDSTVGKGTTFTVSVPVPPQRAADAGASSDSRQ
jgi:signal transduction histidine kinase